MKKRDHKLYSTWKNMMARCYVKSDNRYKFYGAKGVTVAECWHEFWNFVEDIDNHMSKGHLLYRKEYQLDKDLNGGMIYSLENCVVITAKKNRKLANQTHQRKILAINENEKIKFDSVSKASQKLEINRSNIQACLKYGWKNRSGYWFEYCE
jgi:hypothetical protein